MVQIRLLFSRLRLLFVRVKLLFTAIVQMNYENYLGPPRTQPQSLKAYNGRGNVTKRKVLL